MNIFLASLTTFFVGFFTLPILIKGLKKMHLLDQPGGRKIHKGQIPSMGGLAFVPVILVSGLIWFDSGDLQILRYILASLTLIFFVGLRDDMVNLNPYQKLLGQIVAAVIVVVFAEVRLTGFYGFLGIYEFPVWFSYLISVFSIVALTNAFNLIDGLDGLAGSIAAVVLSFFAWWFINAGYMAHGMLSAMLASAVAAFLVFNWHPAKIFMGDTGSLSLGFALSSFTLLFIDINGTVTDDPGYFHFKAPLAMGILLMIVPIYDTIRVFYRRLRAGKSPFSPDKSHVHHYLLRMGLSHSTVTLILSSVLVFFLVLGFIGSNYSDHLMIPIVVVTALSFGWRLDYIVVDKIRNKVKNSPIRFNQGKASGLEKIKRDHYFELHDN